jgi:hypothetical protein
MTDESSHCQILGVSPRGSSLFELESENCHRSWIMFLVLIERGAPIRDFQAKS